MKKYCYIFVGLSLLFQNILAQSPIFKSKKDCVSVTVKLRAGIFDPEELNKFCDSQDCKAMLSNRPQDCKTKDCRCILNRDFHHCESSDGLVVAAAQAMETRPDAPSYGTQKFRDALAVFYKENNPGQNAKAIVEFDSFSCIDIKDTPSLRDFEERKETPVIGTADISTPPTADTILPMPAAPANPAKPVK